MAASGTGAFIMTTARRIATIALFSSALPPLQSLRTFSQTGPVGMGAGVGYGMVNHEIG
jgi:hypothetical protein